MLGNYLHSALRNAIQNPLYAIVNVFGLAIGLACCTLILLFVLDEASYDKHWAAADNIFRLNTYGKPGSGFEDLDAATSAAIFAPHLEADFPDIKEVTRLFWYNPLISRGEDRYYEESFFYADSNFFKVFDFPFLAGDPGLALSEPNSVVLTKKVAEKYFGDEDPMGQTLNYGGMLDLKVTGIITSSAGNTHLRSGMYATMDTLVRALGPGAPALMENWGSSSFYVYVLLRDGDRGDVLEGDLENFYLRHAGEERAGNLGNRLMPVRDIHLHSQMQFEMTPSGSIDFVYMFIAIAAAILLIAVINFANLTTARGTVRAREIGVRKVAGATRASIASQFVLETGLFVLAAMLVAISLAELALPSFNAFTGKEISLLTLLQINIIAPAIVMTVAVTLLSGSWPAAVLSGFRPAAVLKGKSVEGGAGTLRKALVVFQFAVSVGLGIATAVVFQQMSYANSLALGYEKDDVVIVRYNPRRAEQAAAYSTLLDQWRQHPGVLSASGAGTVPTDNAIGGGGVMREGGDPANLQTLRTVMVDYDYFQTFGIDLAAGRAFSRDRSNEILPPFDAFRTSDDLPTTSAVILNEEAAKFMGFASAEDAIGQRLEMPIGNDPDGFDAIQTLDIIGVVPDIYFSSVHTAIQPQSYFLSPRSIGRFAIRLTGHNRTETLRYIDDTWNDLVPSYPITRIFLADLFEEQYLDETRAGQTFTVFTILAFVVAAMGLFGLAAFSASQRTKEVGVRKVLGATIPGIVATMTWDFSKLVIIASVIAAPIAWYVMGRWLEGFAYRTEMNPMVFGGAIMAAFALSTLVVLFHATKAASAPPALSLRDE